MRDVVVLIPGIGGSVLAKDGKDLWAASHGAALRGVLALGRTMRRLQLDGDDPDAADLGDGIVATRVMPDFHVVPGLDWRIDGYTGFLTQLRDRFGCTEGENLFRFPYDWRRDNRVAARRLAEDARVWLRDWRERSGADDARLVLVGHSMGGIVARLYLELFEGWKHTRSLITLGTPYSGAVNSLEYLANGHRPGWGPFAVDLSDMLRSFTSVYQLLPSYRCLEGPGNTWLNLDEVDWTGTAVDGDRVRDALTMHRDLRAAVDERRRGGDEHYDIRPVVGDFQRTRWAARRVDQRVEVRMTRGLDESGGDGTVAKVSAVPHEYLTDWRNAAFVSQRHASLQNDTAVLDHLGGVLSTTGVSAVDIFPATDAWLALEVDHTTTAEPLLVRASPDGDGADLVATVEPVAGGAARRVPLAPASDGWYEAHVEDLPPGDYRVTAAGVGVHAVTDVVSVVDLEEVERDVEAQAPLP